MDVFLFIASATSLVRPYIRDTELRRARERWEKGEIEIVTVKLEPCACDEDNFLGKLQRLAPQFRSIREAKLKPKAWEEVRKDLLPVIADIRKRKITGRTRRPIRATRSNQNRKRVSSEKRHRSRTV